MKKLMFALASCAIFAVALAASSNANAQPGRKGGGGKSFNPTPRVIVAPAKNVPVQQVQVIPNKQINVHNAGPTVRINANLGPAVRINANLGNGPVRPTVRINFNPAPRYTNYHQTHGSRFSHGTYYRGRDHHHWSVQRWDPRYRCYCYWDPCCRMWYYWNQPMQCYYPVSYCPTGDYGGGGPLAQIPVYPGEPINGPMTDESLPPIPAPMYR